jgi:NAD kinase
VRRELDLRLPRQAIDRALVPTYTFTAKDVVVVLGQDGLVANVAKYAGAQPLVGVNPDPERFDGVLLPIAPAGTRASVTRVLQGRAAMRAVTLAEIRFGDRQRLLAFNDLFIGMRTHTSARYRVRGRTWRQRPAPGVG